MEKVEAGGSVESWRGGGERENVLGNLSGPFQPSISVSSLIAMTNSCHLPPTS